MRMANDRDQAIVKSAVPDAGSSLIEFLASLGTREAIAFGEGVPLPTRFRFKDLAADRLPHSTSGQQARLDGGRAMDADFISAVVDRWRDSSTTNTRPRTSVMGLDDDFAADMDDGLGSSLIARKG
jgi:DNA helicase HerA-like ATPase